MWNRGWWSFSSSVTRQPRSASRLEMVEPAGPPPMTRTSHGAGPGSVPRWLSSGCTEDMICVSLSMAAADRDRLSGRLDRISAIGYSLIGHNSPVVVDAAGDRPDRSSFFLL